MIRPQECSAGFGLEAQQGAGSDPGGAQEVFGQRHSVKLAMSGTGFREPVISDIFRNIKSNK